ncbi:hypothetical protein BB561_003348 [Smittium simulii]|uniref:GPN-loop GTPase 2 n=1 Tax=Smittium simulii TaxID=133385 RepID=A0A2T9YLV4_9FUNG|nr:hypothetical protein BB561_003348 [Smittium simulii]
MSFGQIVIGPPGSGKTTYCFGMYQFMNAINRKTIIVNLDPGNENVPYKSEIDINDLITLEDVQNEFQLGPNGSMMYCIEYLENNIDWLINKLKDFSEYYILFDFPGQVEFFTHHKSVRNITKILEKLNFRLTCIYLVDASYCTDANKFISVLMTTLTTMMMIELPQVNVLSKIDILSNMGKLDFSLEYYTQVMDLSYLLHHLNNTSSENFFGLNKILCELIEEFNMIGFQTLCINDKNSVYNLLKEIDKSNGYIFGGLSEGNESIMMSANTTDPLTEARQVQEKYFSNIDDSQNIMKSDREILQDSVSSLDLDNINIIENI